MTAINADLKARNALLELQNALMKRQLYGQRAERSAQLIDRLALSFEELEASATEDELAVQTAVRGTNVEGFVRRRPARRPLPGHPPRERVVIVRKRALLSVLLRAAPAAGRRASPDGYVPTRLLSA